MIAAMTPTLPTTAVLLFDGFDDLDAVGPLELLEGAGFPIAPVRPAGHPRRVGSAHGLTIDVERELGPDAGLVIVPGGGWLDDTVGVRAQCGTALPATLAALHDTGVVLASVCTGAMLLAAAGVLTGRPAVTNRNALDDLAAAGADVRREARVVDDGTILTAGGPACGLDLALHLIGRYADPSVAREAARALEYQPAGPVLVTGAGDQAVALR